MAIHLDLLKLGMCSVSALFCILAMALPYWTVETNGNRDTHVGLWKICSEGKCTFDKKVEDVYNLGSAIHQLERAMVTMGLFLLFGALTCAAFEQLKQVLEQEDGSASVTYIASGLSAIAGMCLLIAFCATAEYVTVLRDQTADSDTSWSYGSSFGLAIVTWLLAWAQSGLFIGLRLRTKSTNSSTP